MKNILTLAFLCVAYYCNAQIAVFKESKQIDGQLSYHAVNNIADTLIISNDEIIKKTSDKIFTYKNPFFGSIDQFDDRNPLQQLVFFKNTQKIVLLDNQLSVRDEISIIDRYPTIEVNYASLTSHAQIWIFDAISKRWGILSNLENEPKWVSNPILDYQFINTFGNYAYWQTNDRIYGIDIYGKIIFNYNLPENAQLLAINTNLIAYILNNKLFLLNTKSNIQQEFSYEHETIVNVYFSAKTLSVFTTNKLYLYDLN